MAKQPRFSCAWQTLAVGALICLCGAALMWNATNIDLQAVQSLQGKYADQSALQDLDEKLTHLEQAKMTAQSKQREQGLQLEQLGKESEALLQRLKAVEARLVLQLPSDTGLDSGLQHGDQLPEPSEAPQQVVGALGQQVERAPPPSQQVERAPPPSQQVGGTVEDKSQNSTETVSASEQRTKRPTKKPAQEKVNKPAWFPFKGPNDPIWNRLQKWFRHALPKPLASWSERQRERHAAALEMLWEPVLQNVTVEWMFGKGCLDNKLSSCTDVCASKGLRCAKQELDAVTTQAKVRAAARTAGSDCGSFYRDERGGSWDGPWIRGDTCGYSAARSRGDCSRKISCGFRRICPCIGNTSGSIGNVNGFFSEVPSLKRQRLMRWHRQWDHKCDADELQTIANASERPKIPRHFHFTVIEDRSNWINWSFPYQLIDAGSPIYKRLTQEEQLLIENMRYSLIKNDAFSVHFLDTMACISACRQMSKGLLRLYLAEGDLRYKSDICRVAALYLEGGYYFDDDMLSYRPVIPLIKDDTEFATAKSISDALYFQSFMASTPCNPIMKRNAEMLEEARQPKPHPKYDGLLGPRTLKLAMDEVTQSGQVKKSHTQLFQESSYNPGDSRYEKVPDRGGHQCGLVVYDPATKKTPFCSRF